VRRVGAAVGDFHLIEPDDHLLLAVSGGKDSLAMLDVLQVLQRRSPVAFRLTVVTIHPGYANFSTTALERYYQERGVSYRIIPVPIDQIVAEKLSAGSIPCALCSRIRRGALYTWAPRLGCNKIALGHHLDDLCETLLMNLFFSGQLRSMAPRYLSDDRQNTIIRPLCYVPEAWLQEYSQQRRLPTMTCTVEGCGVQDSQRWEIKQLIKQLESRYPGLRGHMLHALRHVHPEHLLDLNLHQAIGC
jgi:tRNA 2-thiocytidine biosynthesis protein TtcA